MATTSCPSRRSDWERTSRTRSTGRSRSSSPPKFPGSASSARGSAARWRRWPRIGSGAVSELAGKGRPQRAGPDAVDALRRDGVFDVQGFPLTSAAFDELSALDLPASVTAFAHPSLLLGLGRSERPDPSKDRLEAR